MSIALIFLSYLIIKDFIIPLVSAFILAYLVKPIYNKINPKLGSTLSAIICIILIISIIIVPLGIIATQSTLEAASFVKDVNVKELFQTIKTLPIMEKIDIDIAELTNSTVTFVAKLITSTLSQIPSIILGVFITLLGTFYILVKWDILAKELKKYIPFSKKEKIIKELKTTTDNLVYGLILIGLIEFVVALIGFYLLGIKFYIILSALVFFTAFIPGLGPAAVWVPVVIYFLLTANIPATIGAIALGIILGVGIDFILRGKIMGDKANINPLIMFIGIIGGVSVFGIFGVLIGPLVLVYAIKLANEIIKNK